MNHLKLSLAKIAAKEDPIEFLKRQNPSVDLSQLTSEQIHELAGVEVEKIKEEIQRENHEARKKGEMEASYNSAEARDIDVTSWATKENWTVEEFILLFADRSPTTVSLNMILEDGEGFELYDICQDMLAKLRRANRGWDNLENLAKPKDFREWIADRGYKLSETLEKIFKHFPKAKAQNESAASRRTTTLYKILYAIAKKKYNYDSNNPKNSATANIKSAIDEVGLSLDDDTIRGCLKDSYEYVKSNLPKGD